MHLHNGTWVVMNHDFEKKKIVNYYHILGLLKGIRFVLKKKVYVWYE